MERYSKRYSFDDIVDRETICGVLDVNGLKLPNGNFLPQLISFCNANFDVVFRPNSLSTCEETELKNNGTDGTASNVLLVPCQTHFSISGFDLKETILKLYYASARGDQIYVGATSKPTMKILQGLDIPFVNMIMEVGVPRLVINQKHRVHGCQCDLTTETEQACPCRKSYLLWKWHQASLDGMKFIESLQVGADEKEGNEMQVNEIH